LITITNYKEVFDLPRKVSKEARIFEFIFYLIIVNINARTGALIYVFQSCYQGWNIEQTRFVII